MNDKRTVEGTTNDAPRLGPTTRRLVRSYGVLILIALAFLILALFVREKERTVPVESLPSGPVAAVEVT